MSCLRVIGGTGFEQFAELEPQLSVSIKTPWSDSPVLLKRAQVANTELVFLSRHGEQHSIAPHRINYRANIAALKQVGVDAIIAVNAVGGIDLEIRPGDLVVPKQLIDYTWGREQSFFDGECAPLKHIDFTNPYSDALREQIIQQAIELQLTVHSHGTYGVCQGPRLETAAEIRRMAIDGCDIVGMTGMPEACLARELEIPYACLALVVNPAAGVVEQTISMQEIEQVLMGSMNNVRRLLLALAAQFAVPTAELKIASAPG